MKFLKAALVSSACLLIPVAAQASSLCPSLTSASSAYYGTDTPASMNCNEIITIAANGTASIAVVNANPYDGNDDNYIGIVNHYTGSVSAITLTGPGIFGFDGDGIDTFGIAGNSLDNTGYGGGDAYYTNYSNGNTGTVNFIGGLSTGGNGYFSLEEAPASGSINIGPISTTPEPSSLVLLGTGVLGLAGAVRRRLMA